MNSSEKLKILEKLLRSKQSKASNPLHWDTQFPEKSKFKRFGLRVPVSRTALIEFDPYLEGMSQNDRNRFWDSVWKNSFYFEAMSLALYSFQYRELNKSEFLLVTKWTKKLTCWEHSDDLSKIIAQYVEKDFKTGYSVLKKWNTSKNSWERRQSVVGLLEYSAKRRSFPSFNQLIALIKPLLNDNEYYVQKGIGWTLREIYNLYPKQTIKFIEKNLGSIHPNAYSASVEKLSKEKKKELRERRMAIRKKKSLVKA